MTDLHAEPADATPLTEAERDGLLLPVLTRSELNRAEAENILTARTWLLGTARRLRPELVTDEGWLRRLHRRMYGQVWAWAGEYRTADRNLGVPYWQIRLEMRRLQLDAQTWLSDSAEHRFGVDECAIRLGYRLVVIHPFPNGNGRWSRMASDALAVALGETAFTWGRTSLSEPTVVRREYIAALRTADSDGDLGPLISFARR
ncbi:MAG TPA: mobile mystery protein B [Streptosporangiaceae bacterium]|jgi:Fic-DOC domain mobile mystery protein B